jgi:hypothetical protein
MRQNSAQAGSPLMSSITLLDRLLEQSTTSESKEHVLEQAHYAVDNVQQKMLGKFDELVADIATELGNPEFNASTEGDASKNPMPSWVLGGKQMSDATVKILRLAYWKRESGVSYVLLRMELDSRDRPKYYDLVLGGRRRTKTTTVKMDKLRHTDVSFMARLKAMFIRDKPVK